MATSLILVNKKLIGENNYALVAPYHKSDDGQSLRQFDFVVSNPPFKMDYVDITEEEFNKRMSDYKTTITQQFTESHRLEEEIIKQLDSIGFNANVGKE